MAIADFTDEVLKLAPGKNKGTSTYDDPENNWAVIHNYELMYMKERVLKFRDYDKLSVCVESLLGTDKAKAAKSAAWVGFKALMMARALDKPGEDKEVMYRCPTENKGI